ncbi:hypothetical protein ACQP2U_33405 [Nocardia sp. CA-084685]|uniref:hypothetical protein n=1 Tax=Nocardia sp. CA-084685 TaxID=3239970 RepID=UPI003D95E1AE
MSNVKPQRLDYVEQTRQALVDAAERLFAAATTAPHWTRSAPQPDSPKARCTGTRNGTSAREHFISTARCLYRYAEDNNWIHPTRNPARHLAIPTRPPSHRQAISSPLLAQICQVASLTGNDRELDA